MAKQTSKKQGTSKPANTANAVTVEPAAIPATATSKHATKGAFIVAIGALIVGDGDKRACGSRVDASELSAAEVTRFLGDGTLKPAGE